MTWQAQFWRTSLLVSIFFIIFVDIVLSLLLLFSLSLSLSSLLLSSVSLMGDDMTWQAQFQKTSLLVSFGLIWIRIWFYMFHKPNFGRQACSSHHQIMIRIWITWGNKSIQSRGKPLDKRDMLVSLSDYDSHMDYMGE